jgi:signal transduction histidine kinase
MYRLTDKELIGELQNRFEENRKALDDLRVVTKKLDTVNRKLKESEELKSNFLSNIRNEIVNPLTAIMALAGQVVEYEGSDESLVSTAKLIHLEAFNLDYQLRNIFAAAEIEAGETVLSVSRVDVLSLIQGIIGSFGNHAKSKGLKVKLVWDSPEESGGGLFFKTDPEKLQLVLFNIISNAIEFSVEKKRVDIKVLKQDSIMSIDVTDSCLGIEDEEKERIFDRFRQVDEGVCKSHKGHGLGLSITKFMVDFLHGTLNLSSVKGKGCTFTLNLPEVDTGDDIDVFSEGGNEFIFEGEEEVL